jgi:hypothetical protein
VTDDAGQPILVVVGDQCARRFVGWILAEVDLPAQFVISWRAALVTTNGPPDCVIIDLDDPGDNVSDVTMLRIVQGYHRGGINRASPPGGTGLEVTGTIGDEWKEDA